MKWGLNEEWVKILEQELFNPLRKFRVRTWVFGSRARGNYREFSDLDVLIEPHQALPAGLLSKIREALEESSLPIKVDIVEWENVAESYKKSILQDRIEV